MNNTEQHNQLNIEAKGAYLASFLLLQLLLGYFISCFSFLLGFNLYGWHFFASLGLVLALAFRFSRKLAIWMFALNVLMVILTMFTFTYTHIDASICHSPMAQFMVNGWNPIRDCSFDALRGHFTASGIHEPTKFAMTHILVAPKFAQILAAQLQSAIGLYSATAYSLWFLFFALFIVAYRFARVIWNSPIWIAVCFAGLACCNSLIFVDCIEGLVDYPNYGALAIAFLSTILWVRTKSNNDLFLFFGSLLIALVCKFTGIVCAAILLAFILYYGHSDKRVRYAFLFFFLAFVFCSIIPLGTSTWHFGSPFYPAHSFRSDAQLMDLTADFIGRNDDAKSMGYIARFTYAWVNKDLALWCCKVWYNVGEFAPVWRWDHLVSGCSGSFCVILWSGVLFTIVFARNQVGRISLLFMIAFMLIPTKFIGYPRYVAFIHIIVSVLWFNLAFLLKGFLQKFVLFICLFTSCDYINNSVIEFFIQIRNEGARQENLNYYSKSSKKCLPVRNIKYEEDGEIEFYDEDELNLWRYVLNTRLDLVGVKMDESERENIFEMQWPFIMCGPGLKTRSNAVIWGKEDKFPMPVFRKRGESTQCH